MLGDRQRILEIRPNEKRDGAVIKIASSFARRPARPVRILSSASVIARSDKVANDKKFTTACSSIYLSALLQNVRPGNGDNERRLHID